MDNIRVTCSRREWEGTVAFLLFEADMSGHKTHVGRNVIMEKLEPDQRIQEPTFTISSEAAQVLVNHLWELGLRPSEYKGQESTVSAVKYHLEDMRRLVFERQ